MHLCGNTSRKQEELNVVYKSPIYLVFGADLVGIRKKTVQKQKDRD